MVSRLRHCLTSWLGKNNKHLLPPNRPVFWEAAFDAQGIETRRAETCEGFGLKIESLVPTCRQAPLSSFFFCNIKQFFDGLS